MRPCAVAAVLALLAVALAPSSCGSSEVSCSDVCDCRGLPGDAACLSECDRSHAEEKASATSAGCATEYASLEACLAGNSICDTKRKELVVPVSACGADVTALLDCEFPVMPTSASSSVTTSGGGTSSTGAGGGGGG